MARDREEQVPLAGFPFACSFTDCQEDAVCGLRHKGEGEPEHRINVCAPHFKNMTGRDWKPSESAIPKVMEGRRWVLG